MFLHISYFVQLGGTHLLLSLFVSLTLIGGHRDSLSDVIKYKVPKYP